MTLKAAREAAGLTQQELETRARLGTGTVRDIESGKNGNPSWRVVRRLTVELRKRGKALNKPELRKLTEAELFPVETAGVR